MAGLTDYFTNQNVLIVLAIAAIVYFAFFYNKNEGLENVKSEAPAITLATEEIATEAAEAHKQVETSEFRCLENMPSVACADYQPGEGELTPQDLLPKYDQENEFAQNPVGELLKEKNFLISGYHLGINTVMSSNKLPYYDLRSLPVIPKEEVGPWSQSSYEKSPASQRRGFEIGV
jgi:hypothetical protein